MKIPHLRWWIATLLVGAAVLNYVDRQTLSALAPTIQADLQMDDRAYANVVNLFLVAYTIAYLVSGRIADLMGTRASMVVFVVWWSFANMLTAAAQGVQSLGVYRFLLGLGEAGVWPAASKAVSEWFPAKERALAIGLYTMGATLGATLAPYLVIPLATHAWGQTLPGVAGFLGQGAGWRIAFILTGAAGLLWLIPWLWMFRAPRDSKLITPDELQMLEKSSAAETPGGANEKPWTWLQVFTFRGTWLLLVGRLITDPVWYFYQFWFPKYLSRAAMAAHNPPAPDPTTTTSKTCCFTGVFPSRSSLAAGWDAVRPCRTPPLRSPRRSRRRVIAPPSPIPHRTNVLSVSFEAIAKGPIASTPAGDTPPGGTAPRAALRTPLRTPSWGSNPASELG